MRSISGKKILACVGVAVILGATGCLQEGVDPSKFTLLDSAAEFSEDVGDEYVQIMNGELDPATLTPTQRQIRVDRVRSHQMLMEEAVSVRDGETSP